MNWTWTHIFKFKLFNMDGSELCEHFRYGTTKTLRFLTWETFRPTGRFRPIDPAPFPVTGPQLRAPLTLHWFWDPHRFASLK